MAEKRCQRCKRTKPVEAFHLNRARSSGRGAWCKECVREYRNSLDFKNRASERARYADNTMRSLNITDSDY